MPRAKAIIRDRLRRVLFRTRAWKRVFTDPKTGALSGDGQIVLAHLKRFARYGKNPVTTDQSGRTDLYQTGCLAGRQEVVQLLIEALNLDERLLVNMQEDIPDES